MKLQKTMKPVIITNLVTKEQLTFPGLRRAADYIGTSYSNIHAAAHKTKCFSAKGWSVDFVNEDDKTTNPYVKVLSTYQTSQYFTDKDCKTLSIPSTTGQCARLVNFTNYIIYDNGDIYSQPRRRFLKPWVSSDGYLEAILTQDDGTRKNVKVHRVIACAFLNADPDETKVFVNHINGDKSDNRVDNLEWCNREENYAHARRIGTCKHNKPLKCIHKKTGEIKIFNSKREAAKELGIPRSTVMLITGPKQQKNSTDWNFEVLEKD